MKILRLTGCIDLLIFFKVTCISKRIILIFSDSGSSSLKSLHSNSQSDVPTNQIDALLSVRYLFMFFFLYKYGNSHPCEFLTDCVLFHIVILTIALRL